MLGMNTGIEIERSIERSIVLTAEVAVASTGMSFMDIMGVKEVSWTLVVVNDEVGTAICWAATKWETLPRPLRPWKMLH